VGINWTIDADTILQLVALLGAILKSHTAIRERLVRIETRLDYIEDVPLIERPE
jgi:hypothetical protein